MCFNMIDRIFHCILNKCQLFLQMILISISVQCSWLVLYLHGKYFRKELYFQLQWDSICQFITIINNTFSVYRICYLSIPKFGRFHNHSVYCQNLFQGQLQSFIPYSQIYNYIYAQSFQGLFMDEELFTFLSLFYYYFPKTI